MDKTPKTQIASNIYLFPSFHNKIDLGEMNVGNFGDIDNIDDFENIAPKKMRSKLIKKDEKDKKHKKHKKDKKDKKPKPFRNARINTSNEGKKNSTGTGIASDRKMIPFSALDKNSFVKFLFKNL